jgi:thiol-disulfide isomerase/thioredoxin
MTTQDPADPADVGAPAAPPASGAPAAPPASDAPAAPSVDPGAAVRRPATSLLTWGTVALVLVIVVVLVVIKLTGSPSASTPSSLVTPSPAPPSVAKAITSIRASVYNAIGTRSIEAVVTPPSLLHGQPPLTDGGKPEIVFVGNEFCPYCAAERWAIVAALSRFGGFGDTLYAMQSGSNEVFPGTPTFTFDGTRYRSKYLAATLVEHYGDQKNAAGTAYALLERLSPTVHKLVTKYDRATAAAPTGVVPFVDIANKAVVAGGEFSPSVFQQLSASDIASGLTDPKDPATQAIVAAANYLSALICEADGQAPSRVCSSRGVIAAARALGLAP